MVGSTFHTTGGGIYFKNIIHAILKIFLFAQYNRQYTFFICICKCCTDLYLRHAH